MLGLFERVHLLGPIINQMGRFGLYVLLSRLRNHPVRVLSMIGCGMGLKAGLLSSITGINWSAILLKFCAVSKNPFSLFF